MLEEEEEEEEEDDLLMLGDVLPPPTHSHSSSLESHQFSWMRYKGKGVTTWRPLLLVRSNRIKSVLKSIKEKKYESLLLDTAASKLPPTSLTKSAKKNLVNTVHKVSEFFHAILNQKGVWESVGKISERFAVKGELKGRTILSTTLHYIRFDCFDGFDYSKKGPKCVTNDEGKKMKPCS